jgi:hypothetical protein
MAAFAALACAGPLACAQEVLIPPERHSWAKFPKGSWKRMRVTRESFDERGVSTTSVEEIKTTIIDVTANDYTLLGEQTTEFAGRKTLRSSQQVKYGYSGETDKETVGDVKFLGERELLLNGRKILCEIRQATVIGADMARTAVTVYYSRDVFPHALKREFGPVGDAATPTTIEEVVALAMPYKVLDRRSSVAFVHTRQKLPTHSRETMEVTCDEVPGGIVDQWRKELDADGKLIHRTTFELIEYEVMEPVPVPMARPRIFDRKRARRAEEKLGVPRR